MSRMEACSLTGFNCTSYDRDESRSLIKHHNISVKQEGKPSIPALEHWSLLLLCNECVSLKPKPTNMPTWDS